MADPIPVPVSDVAEWDDDERLERYPAAWPFSGRSEEEVMAAAAKLPDIVREDDTSD